jgi:hypothetical protein
MMMKPTTEKEAAEWIERQLSASEELQRLLTDAKSVPYEETLKPPPRWWANAVRAILRRIRGG